MTTEPKASLGGDGAKRSAPVAWLLTHPTEPTDCELASPWKEPITDADRAAGWSAEPLYRAAAPALPVEVREKIARIIDPLAYELTDALNSAEGEPEQLRRDATALRDARVAKALAKADAILSTITGDA